MLILVCSPVLVEVSLWSCFSIQNLGTLFLKFLGETNDMVSMLKVCEISFVGTGSNLISLFCFSFNKNLLMKAFDLEGSLTLF